MLRKATNKVKTRSIRKAAGGFLAVVLVGLAGSYLLFGAKAFDFPVQPPKFFTYFEDWVEGGANGFGPTGGWASNDTMGIEIRASFVVPAGETKQLVIVATADSSRVKYLRYDCGDVGSCRNSGWSGSQSSLNSNQLQAYSGRDAVVCIDVPPGTYTKVNLLTVRYKSLTRIRSNNPSAAPDGWFAVRGGATDGSCDSNRAANGVVFGDLEASEGGCGGGGFTTSCTGGPGEGSETPGGSNPGGQGGSDKGSGSGKTGTGTGGGSSGSTATKQGDTPNSTPSSSSQGDEDQTKQDPNPFYDGKQYQQGSESDSSFGGLFNKPTNGGIARGWYFLTALILLAGGLGIWWRKKTSRISYATNRK